MTKQKSNHVLCTKCGEPVTWFNFRNIWEYGVIASREHVNCNASDILAYNAKRLGNT